MHNLTLFKNSDGLLSLAFISEGEFNEYVGNLLQKSSTGKFDTMRVRMLQSECFAVSLIASLPYLVSFHCKLFLKVCEVWVSEVFSKHSNW